ncbi:uncharacterized protein J8A68_005029 [[Candida] subhashii]|uniref:CUE domain-containing protein n=1 Tax=[Candida] subhashii TaxID=561895 RepID=A0A8J5QHW8_9ASCO|nr:uncharacterized protein J8A68_005029 [[Candida] subhashii]KAG7661451.1 hypothetical protein J8A68_005029 [[Candida] subhashii]
METTEEGSIYIPIPHYPPFKLRSSLIDKDPVIWVHLLEAYIKLIEYLLDPNSAKLSVKSQQQLQLFLKVFLSETCEEETKIFSLGAINPDIKQNTTILRVYVFQLIKNYSFVKLNLTGEAIWHFVRIYGKTNINTVRGLVDGTYKSKFNDNKKSGNISTIGSVQKHLETLIINGKLSQDDLECLSTLLGQHTASVKTTVSIGSANAVTRRKQGNKSGQSSLAFAESFVDSKWIEILEKHYVGGKGVFADVIKQVMIISVISLSTAKLAALTMELGISSLQALQASPLFSSIIISEAYKELIPNLEERLPFLRNVNFNDEDDEEEEYEDDDDDGFEQNIEGISLLIDLFPQMTDSQAKTILKQNNGDVEHVTNMLLENPDIISTIPERLPKPPKSKPKPKSNPQITIKSKSKQPIAPKRSIYDDDEISKGDFSGTTVIFGKQSHSKQLDPTSEELKKKTLNAALRLMYESDEDEPDDTYDDQEKMKGVASGVNDDSEARKGKAGAKMRVLEDDDSGSGSSSRSGIGEGIDERERYLFGIFKTQGTGSFEKSARKSSGRQALKKSTSWSDEQIEGWLRMLIKSPRRFKILEEDFFYGGGNPNRRARKNVQQQEQNQVQQQQPQKKTQQKVDNDEVDKSEKKQNSKKEPKDSNKQFGNEGEKKPPKSKEASKRSNARNEKNKASKANHNRKSQHDKKNMSGL